MDLNKKGSPYRGVGCFVMSNNIEFSNSTNINLDDVSSPLRRAGYLSPQEVEAHAATVFTERDPDQRHRTFCGDERGVDELSVRALDQIQAVLPSNQRREIAPVNDGGVAVYGAFPGMVHNTMAAIMVQAGTDAEKAYFKLGGITGLQQSLASRMTSSETGMFAVEPTLHTAADKEIIAFNCMPPDLKFSEQTLAIRGLLAVTESNGQNLLFCPHGSEATGCAYCMNAGAVSHGLGNNTAFQEKAIQDMAWLNDGQDPQWASQIFETHGLLADLMPGQEKFAYGRQAYETSGLPVMVLEGGPHALAKQTSLLISLDPTAASKPGRHYRDDIAASALATANALPEFHLDPRLLMESMIATAVPTRAVLASHDISGDHTPDPARIAIGGYGGTIDSAVDTIERYTVRHR